MSKQKRRIINGEDKVKILKKHLLEGVRVSAVCEAFAVTPGMFYEWQRLLFEKGSELFDAKKGRQAEVDLRDKKIKELEAALAALPPRDAKVLRLYFGLDDGTSRTLEEIGRMMGVTRERIRQLRDRALIRLREGETGEKLKDLVAT